MLSFICKISYFYETFCSYFFIFIFILLILVLTDRSASVVLGSPADGTRRNDVSEFPGISVADYQAGHAVVPRL